MERERERKQGRRGEKDRVREVWMMERREGPDKRGMYDGGEWESITWEIYIVTGC